MSKSNCEVLPLMFQLAPKPVQLQGTVGQQPRVIVPAIAPNLSTSSTGLQFPHGLISGGVVYLPQVQIKFKVLVAGITKIGNSKTMEQ